MKETGIIMSGDHPQKTLDGTKTMTRRTYGLEEINKHLDLWRVTPTLNPVVWGFYQGTEANPTEIVRIKCPYGQVGDRLWVRETHYRHGFWVLHQSSWKFNPSGNIVKYNNIYDNEPPSGVLKGYGYKLGWYKRPSIFMPRWASRITLEITEVRAERLWEITPNDCIAEGVSPDVGGEGHIILTDHISPFARLWDSLNAKRGYGWEVNCWVWPIRYKLVNQADSEEG